MKILILARGIPNNHDPQEGCFEWDQAQALAARGHQVVVMAVDSRVRKFWRPLGITKIQRDGITAYKSFYFPTSIIRRLISFKLGYRIEAWQANRLFKHIVKRHGDFDIVHSHYLNCSYYGASLKKNYGVKLVATEHWSKLKDEKLQPSIQYLGENTYKYLDKLISVSKHLGESIQNDFRKDFCVIHNLIDTTKLSAALKRTNNAEFVVLAVGSLIKIKGFDVLIKGYAKSKLATIPSRLKIFGNGVEYENLRGIIDDLNLRDRVILCGQKKKDEIYNELHNADLYVLSSHSENFSVALIEATANGVPAIGTLCGGVQEYPIDICKIPVNDIDAMADALDKCYENRNSVDRIALQKETLKYFSPDAIASQLEEVYKSVLSK